LDEAWGVSVEQFGHVRVCYCHVGAVGFDVVKGHWWWKIVCADEGRRLSGYPLRDPNPIALGGFNPEFSDKYARAREIQGHVHASLAVESAIHAEDAGLGRLAYDALKWHASKLVPRVYGDKSEVVMTGANGGPVQSQSVTVPADPIEAARVYQKFMSGDG
jgi:hypothetical protein